MIKNILILIAASTILALGACKEKGLQPDAYGNFEVSEVLISAEIPGKILMFTAEEGQRLKKNALVAQIDTSDLILKKEQLLARRRAVAVNKSGVIAEVAVLEEQAVSLNRELERTASLLKKGAASQRQYDEMDSQLNVINRKISAIRTRNSGILSEIAVIDAQIDELDANIRKCTVHNPVEGIVLVAYAEAHEMTGAGKPLYKIASLDTLYLRAYISGDQLSSVAIGEEVSVQFDGEGGTIRSLPGTLTWVASEAEFTPKIIQTREERVNMVYAIKVKVANDGSLKIGMPGEVVFDKDQEEQK